jgi:hypothetical protein
MAWTTDYVRTVAKRLAIASGQGSGADLTRDDVNLILAALRVYRGGDAALRPAEAPDGFQIENTQRRRKSFQIGPRQRRRAELALAKIAASNAPPIEPFLTGTSLARFMAAEERRIFVTDRIAEIEG